MSTVASLSTFDTDRRGKKFGPYTYLSSYLNDTGHLTVNVRCTCGKEEAKSWGRLRRLSHQPISCRHNPDKSKRTTPIRVKAGDRFGRLTVVDVNSDVQYYRGRQRVVYFCFCRCDCGEVKRINKCNLTRGAVTSCGCRLGEYRNARRVYGPFEANQNGYTLLRLLQEGEQYRSDLWEVRCSCGVIKPLRFQSIQSGVKCNCGPRSKYVGRRFGSLRVLSTYQKGSNQYAICICDCGNQRDIRMNSLVRGATKSCGCRIHLKIE